MVDTPVGTLTTGSDVMTPGGGLYLWCGPSGGPFITRPTAARYALSTLNNVTALRQLLSQEGYYVPDGQSCPRFGLFNYYRGVNVMCCNEVVE